MEGDAERLKGRKRERQRHRERERERQTETQKFCLVVALGRFGDDDEPDRFDRQPERGGG